MCRAHGRRLARLEAPYQCPRHRQWLQCGCGESDPDRLTAAEHARVDHLLGKAGYTPILSATPCRRCGEAMICVPCQTPTWVAACAQLTPDEQRLLGDLLTKALISSDRPLAHSEARPSV